MINFPHPPGDPSGWPQGWAWNSFAWVRVPPEPPPAGVTSILAGTGIVTDPASPPPAMGDVTINATATGDGGLSVIVDDVQPAPVPPQGTLWWNSSSTDVTNQRMFISYQGNFTATDPVMDRISMAQLQAWWDEITAGPIPWTVSPGGEPLPGWVNAYTSNPNLQGLQNGLWTDIPLGGDGGLTPEQEAVLAQMSTDDYYNVIFTMGARAPNFYTTTATINTAQTQGFTVPNLAYLGSLGFLQWNGSNWVRAPGANGSGTYTVPFYDGTPPIQPEGSLYWDKSEDAGHSRLFISYQDNWVATDAIRDRDTLAQMKDWLQTNLFNIVAPITDNNPLPLWMFNELNDAVGVISINVDAYLNKLQDLAARVDALENQDLPPGQGHMTFVTQGGFAGGQTLDPPSAPFTISNANQIEAVTTSPGTASGSSQNWTVSKIIPMNGGWSASPAIAFVSFAAVSGTVEVGTQGQVTMQAATTVQPGERVTWYPQVSSAGTCATTMTLHLTPQ